MSGTSVNLTVGRKRYNEFSDNGLYDFGCLGCEVAEGDDLLPADLRDTYWGPKPQTLEEIDARVLDDEEAEGVRPTPLVSLVDPSGQARHGQPAVRTGADHGKRASAGSADD